MALNQSLLSPKNYEKAVLGVQRKIVKRRGVLQKKYHPFTVTRN
jgi:hypothetical protein